MKSNLFKKSLGLLFALALLPMAVMAQTITVKGVVKDNTGQPLPGVNVIVEGTTNGSITDLDGNYSLTVPSGSSLLYSFIGFETKTEVVAGRTTINVTLQDESLSVGEVVVVGYGQMKRSDITGSVVSVGDDAIKKSVITSVDQVLQGRAAGVQVQQNSGTPGGSSSIRIRGVNSLNASNEPIFVIDGVVIDGSTGSGSDNALASINPSDIVSMDVLKDASATAIYGARAANGVIMITTKRGQNGEANITYDGYFGLQQMPVKLDLLNLRQYAELKNVKAEAGLLQYDNNFINPSLLGNGTDWQDELFQTATMHSHNLSVTGGNEKTTYALGGGYLNQEGIAIGSSFKRVTLRGNVDSQVKSWLKMGVNMTFSNSNQEITVDDNSLILVALKQTPNVAVRNADGEFDGPDTDEYVQNNPVGLAMMKTNENNKTGIRANTYAEATIIKGLTYKTELSFDYGFTNSYKFDPTYSFGAINNETNEATEQKNFSRFWSWRNVLNYNRTLAEVHAVNIMLGQEMQQSKWEYISANRKGFLTNTETDISMGDQSTSIANGQSGESKIASFFGRAFYSFADKYLLTFTLRNDGSSNFADGERWGLFPAAALAWKISNESFLKENPVINGAKLRLGWGKVGNQNVNAYSYASTLSTVTTPWGTGILPGNTANPKLQWETTQSYNLGIDLNLFENRIEFIGDFYLKQTDNLLLQLPLPAYIGTDSGQGSCSAPWANIGSLENKGVELTLNTVNIDYQGFQWRSNIVFSLNRNKVKSLDTETSVINKTIQQGSETTIVTRTSVDEAIGQFYGYKVKGRFDKATDFYYKKDGEIHQVALPKGSKISENDTWLGDFYFEDVNGDGVIDEEDRTFIGNPEPKFTFGFGNSFSYKGFDLSVNLTGSYGNDVVNYQRRWLENPRENTNLYTSALGYARVGKIDESGPDDDYRNLQVVGGASDMPRLATSTATSTSNYRFSDKFIEDGSYLRISNISFSYTLPKRLISKAELQNVKVYANLQNVYTWTKYSGYDPEIGSLNQDALMSGIDNGRYPSPRIYTFGLNVTF